MRRCPALLSVTLVAVLVACTAAPHESSSPSSPEPQTPPASAEPTGAGTPRPTLRPSSPTPVHSPAATPLATASPTSNVIDLTADAIRTVVADGIWPHDGFAQFGPLVASVTETGIELLDLEHQTTTELYATRRNERILSLEMSGDTVAWAVGKYDRNSRRAPCDIGGGLTWRIVAHTISTGSEAEIASGRHVEVIGCAAWAPTVAVDGELVAYTVEASGPSAWEIVVRSLESGEVVRTIATGRVVADLDLDGMDVAYVTGVPDDPSNPYFVLSRRRLMLSVATEPEPKLVAPGPSWSVSFAGGRMAWATNRESSSGQRWTATIEDLTHVRISDAAERVSSPRTSGSLVTFGKSSDTKSVGQIWDERTNVIYEVAPDLWMEGLFSNGGWLVWYGDRYDIGNEVALVQGLPLTEVPELAE